MQTNEVMKRFLNEEQDPAVVQQVHDKIAGILTSSEEVLYIAVQKKPVVNVAPESVVLTSRRLIVCRPKMLGGFTFDDHIWRDVAEVHLKEGLMGSTLTIKTVDQPQKPIAVEYLPKAQAKKVYSLSQEMEEKVLEERRQRELEDKRAAAGGVVVQSHGQGNQAAPAKDDPIQVLTKLKGMLDAGLISQAEYDSKKSEILARM